MATKKPAVKKVTTKKKVTRKVTTKKSLPPLVVVSDSLAFWTIDGQEFCSLAELADGLLTMERRVYNYHADQAYQDFAVWVGQALKAKPCALLLKKAKTAQDAKKIIDTYLQAYKETNA